MYLEEHVQVLTLHIFAYFKTYSTLELRNIKKYITPRN